MVHFTADPKRSELGFTRAARTAFKFLEDDLGFHVARVEEPTFVRYESPNGFVNVYHSRGGYRVGAEIGRFIRDHGKQIEDRVSLLEVAGAAGDEEAAQSLDVPVESAAAVVNAVQEAARIVRRYGAGLLHGDEKAYSKIAEYRHWANERHAEEGARLWKMRQAAHSAWKQGDRKEAARLLRQLPGLTDDEKRMLSMANGESAGESQKRSN